MSNSKKVPSIDTNHLLQWLDAHPLISRHALCEMVGYNSGNLYSVSQGRRPLPQKHAKKMAEILKQYGYTHS